ncbi:MAG: sulfurtransferase [Gammaproteobacteria bacterium]|nr:sulfurtransferase [Gammaproteobacteria bacterium]
MKTIISACMAVMLGVSASGVFAYDASKVPEAKRTTLGLYLDSNEAYALATKEKVLFLDVRTREEVNFLGMPTLVDANIPYMEMDPMYNWDDKKNVYVLEPNSEFVTMVAARLKAKGMKTDDPVIVMCRSGDRSARAADLLAKAGYSKVYSIVDGFEGDLAKDGPNAGRRTVNGWKNSNLPWSYTLAKEKMSLE